VHHDEQTGRVTDRVHRQRGADLREGVEEEACPELQGRQRREVLARRLLVAQLVYGVEAVEPVTRAPEREPQRQPEGQRGERELPRGHPHRAQPGRREHAGGEQDRRGHRRGTHDRAPIREERRQARAELDAARPGRQPEGDGRRDQRDAQQRNPQLGPAPGKAKRAGTGLHGRPP
jgi:hypothetical protein